ncbi:MAG: ferrochelatase [Streptosporangiales bacterium]|nr:ferrochelatase [Streptosporangiales bacterium]
MPAYDAFLLLSFGGPEGPDDVMPFLENVTRGRGVPRERLSGVAEHYYARGGVSPINGQCREMLAAIKAAGLDLPAYWGNRNWAPFAEDTVRRMADDGIERAVAFVTSAYSSYSACRQYLDDIDRAVAAVGPRAPRIDKIRPYFGNPGFIEPFADSTRAALETLPAGQRDGARLVFTAHSVPAGMAAASGSPSAGTAAPAIAGGRYEAELRQASALITERIGRSSAGFDLVWQSRSGPPSVPWLEPDVCDHIRALAKGGVPAVVVVPVGFVSDHMEVVHDLDTEAREVAESLGMGFARAAAPGSTPRFAKMAVDLVAAAAADPGTAVGCPEDCCRYIPRRPGGAA